MRVLLVLLLIVAVGYGVALQFVPASIERNANKVTVHEPYTISTAAQELHKKLLIGDFHADSTLWRRDLLERSDRGHVDIPRMREGNVAIQMFTSVTKSPRGQNYHSNSTDASDNITLLAAAQAWPISTLTSLTARALYQAEKLHDLEDRAPEEFQLILNKKQLNRFLAMRQAGERVVAGLIGTEGSHALDGDLANIEVLYDAGFRMMSLQHFFDNKLGGSLHGESGAGLTEFGVNAVKLMLEQGIMIDVSHSAPQVVVDVLAISNKPLIVSHTGLNGHCESDRNISDELMQEIAAAGGIIGIGFWDGAVCDTAPANIVKALRYGIELVGVKHIALGSDYDGSVETQFDISEIDILTHEMLKAGFTELEIKRVMGQNMVEFLQKNLP